MLSSLLSGTPTTAEKFTTAIESRDPQQVIDFVKDNQDQIIKDPGYIPQLVRVLKEFQTNLKLNKQVLGLFLGSVESTDKYIISLCNKGGLKQMVDNMNNFYDEPSIVSLSLYILGSLLVVKLVMYFI